MEPVVNRQLFELVNFDSAVPGGSATVVHRFTAEGQYVLSLLREDRVVETATALSTFMRSMIVAIPSAPSGTGESVSGSTGTTRAHGGSA